MHVLKFKAKTLQEALEAVREKLGPDAEVIRTQQIRESRLGFFATNSVEVHASLAVTASAPNESEQGSQTFSEQVQTPNIDVTRSSGTPATFANENLLAELRRRLAVVGIPPSCASELLDEIRPGVTRDAATIPELEAQLNSVLANRLATGGTIQPVKGQQQICAFVGTSGVGKTNCLSQIAANLRFEIGCRVGLVSLDSGRMGAADQMRQFAEFISSPFELVNSSGEMVRAISSLADCEVVLIDTPASHVRIPFESRLLACLTAVQLSRVFWVLNGSTQPRFASYSSDAIKPLTATNIIITHLDEAIEFGSWTPFLLENRLPVSYLSIGPEIHGDLVVAHPRRLARALQCESQV